jgi:hypothetical protein
MNSWPAPGKQNRKNISMNNLKKIGLLLLISGLITGFTQAAAVQFSLGCS